MNNEIPQDEYTYYPTQYRGLYNLLLTILKTWNIWEISSYDGVVAVYEGELIEILKHLPQTHNVEEVYTLLTKIFVDVHPYFYARKSEELHRMAQEIWFYWNQYLKVKDAQPYARARALLLQF